MVALQHVVIDTNYFIGDPQLRNATWGDLLAAQQEDRIKVYVPEVVVREQVRLYVDPHHRELDKALGEFGRSHKVLTKRGLHLPEVDLADVRAQRRGLVITTDYDRDFRQRLDSAGATVLPLPTVDTEDLARRYFNGQKPFKENGDGIADYLIWRTIVELHDSVPALDEIVVITKNTADFVDGGRLHPNLASDVDEDRVKWFPHSTDFVRHLVAGSPKLISARFYPLKATGGGETTELFRAYAAAETYVNGPLLYSQISTDESYGDVEIVGYEPHQIFESPTIEGVDLDESSATWSPYEEYDDGTILGRLDVSAELHVTAFAYKSDLAIHEEVTVSRGDHNDHMSEVSDYLTVVIQLHIRITGDDSQVLNIETIELSRAGDIKNSVQG